MIYFQFLDSPLLRVRKTLIFINLNETDKDLHDAIVPIRHIFKGRYLEVLPNTVQGVEEDNLVQEYVESKIGKGNFVTNLCEYTKLFGEQLQDMEDLTYYYNLCSNVC